MDYAVTVNRRLFPRWLEGRNDGLLTAVIEAACATDGYAVLEGGLVSRLDHVAYLGRELARAEHALDSGTRYQQDAAPG